MPGLSTSPSGLSFGIGLIYPIVPADPSVQHITFAGVGALAINALVYEYDILEGYTGSGALSIGTVLAKVAGRAGFAGAGQLTVNATVV